MLLLFQKEAPPRNTSFQGDAGVRGGFLKINDAAEAYAEIKH